MVSDINRKINLKLILQNDMERKVSIKKLKKNNNPGVVV
jgi:hypothetical protein